MSHLFGMGSGHLPRKANIIAKKHGAELVNHTEPRGAKRHWFSGPNLGEPFDSTLSREVIADLQVAGLIDPKCPTCNKRHPEREWRNCLSKKAAA